MNNINLVNLESCLLLNKSHEEHKHEHAIRKRPKRIILNARGFKYDVVLNDFDKLPNSRLGKLKVFVDNYKLDLDANGNINNIHENNKLLSLLNEICDDYDFNLNEFYFNRDPYVLNLILNYLSNDRLHIDKSICPYLLRDELNYWHVDEYLVDSCCLNKYFNKRDEVANQILNEEKILYEFNHKDDFGNLFMPRLREKIWNIVENSRTCLAGKVKVLVFKTFK